MKLTTRSVQDMLKGDVHPKLVRILCEIIEQHNTLEKTVGEFAKVLDGMCNLMNQYNMIAEGLQRDVGTKLMEKRSEGDKYDDPE